MKVCILLLTGLLSVFLSSCGGKSPDNIDTQAEQSAATMLATAIKTTQVAPPATINLPATQTAKPVPTATILATDMTVNGVAKLVDASSRISGETLEVVLQVQYLPSELTFSRPGIPKNIVEYKWSAAVDVDNDRQTGGSDGFEYDLTAYFLPQGDDPFTASLQQTAKAEIWQCEEGGCTYFSDATLLVDTITNTITLKGHIPGITPESRVYYCAYDYFEGGDFLKNPATKLVDASSQLSGETLEVTLQMLDLPSELKFRRPDGNTYEGVTFYLPSTTMYESEYEWGVKIDVDNDTQTGDSYGIEYELIAYFPKMWGDSFTAPIQKAVKAEVWHYAEDGWTYFSDATFIVDTDFNTITLSGYIPGVTTESKLYFFTFDYLNGANRLK